MNNFRRMFIGKTFEEYEAIRTEKLQEIINHREDAKQRYDKIMRIYNETNDNGLKGNCEKHIEELKKIFRLLRTIELQTEQLYNLQPEDFEPVRISGRNSLDEPQTKIRRLI